MNHGVHIIMSKYLRTTKQQTYRAAVRRIQGEITQVLEQDEPNWIKIQENGAILKELATQAIKDCEVSGSKK